MTGPLVVARLRAAGCVWAEDEAALLQEAATSPADLETLLVRRVAGEPLETVLGWVEFLGRRLVVAPGVFVPRRRTVLLARTTIDEVAARSGAPDGSRVVVVEMCCGVAPVAACVDARVADLHVADVSDVALACASHNAPDAVVHRGDLYAALSTGLRGRVGVIAANAPYVPTTSIATMPPEARDHEPTVALDGGADGVDLHRRLAAGAGAWLAPGGVLIVETSPAQAHLTAAAMATGGLVTRMLLDEEVGGCVVLGERRVSSRAPARERV